ncbi:xylulokinase [Kaistia algarum]|uniref:xylulokinase n=1 Tax=Kaistia algarum TaxID=2083279 RepID=UPI001401C971|nr:FGGY family carbohydrate kinase [Kaistia algarum]MCX5512732.1 FGGY family carbohydrate kinase [Kaistia algarum]
MTLPAVLGIDIGTSSVKALLIDAEARVVGVGRGAYPTAQPAPGLSEQDPEDWKSAAIVAVRAALAGAEARVEAISFSGHMSAPVLLGEDGAALAACHTIADQRSVGEIALIDAALTADIAARTGNFPAAHLTLPKLLWWKRHHPEIFARTRFVLMPKDYLRLWMTGDIAADPTDSGNSMLFDASRRDWAEDLAKRAGIGAARLPRLREPGEIAGALLPGPAEALGLAAGLPVVTGAADMAAMLLGSGVDLAGDVAVTIGTSANVIAGLSRVEPSLIGAMNVEPGLAPHELYAIGSHFGGGGALGWLAGLLSGAERPDPAVLAPVSLTAEGIALGSEGLIFLPYLSGGGSPSFDPAARGAFLGLAMKHGSAHMLRAIVEGVTCDLGASLDLFAGLAPRRRILFSGGGSRIAFWPQLLADMSGLPVVNASASDASALGAALIAGVGIGWFGDSFSAARALVAPKGPAFEPRPTEATAELRRRFERAKIARRPDLLAGQPFTSA